MYVLEEAGPVDLRSLRVLVTMERSCDGAN